MDLCSTDPAAGAVRAVFSYTPNTPIPRPTPLTTPNGIRIRSAVLPQCTFRTDRPTDRQMGQATGPYHERFARYADMSDALIIIDLERE